MGVHQASGALLMTPADIGWDNDLWGEENPGSSLGLSMFLFCIFFDFWGMGRVGMDREGFF
jgi:hypothetical protein